MTIIIIIIIIMRKIYIQCAESETLVDEKWALDSQEINYRSSLDSMGGERRRLFGCST